MIDRPTPETDACPHCGTESYGHDERDYWKCGTIHYEEKYVVRTDLCNEREARKAAESKLAEARERERVAILSFDEERQRALREGKRVLEARRERDEEREDATNYYAKIGELEQERNKAMRLFESGKPLYFVFGGVVGVVGTWIIALFFYIIK